MTIEQWGERAPLAPLADHADRAVARLTDWAGAAQAAYAVAERLADSAFVPAQFKGKPVELTAAILAGQEVGLSPMAAMRSFDIIQGTAAPRAVTLRAIVQSFGHEMVLVESTATRCRMKGRRRGTQEWQAVDWTIDRAGQLGLTGKDGWKKQPTAMLLARATSELARLIAADAILGIGYTSEEVADGPADESEAVTAAPKATTRRMSRTAPTPEPAPGPPAEPEPADVADADPMLDTGSDLARALFAKMGEHGIKDKPDRLELANLIIGHPIDGSADLTEAEARDILHYLDALPVDGGAA